MAARIARYHVADFGTVEAAINGTARIIEYLGSVRGLRHTTGPRRAVLWGRGPEASAIERATLYLSDGALEAAREAGGLAFTLTGTIDIDAMSATCIILFGDAGG
jgi:hypothetical protein